MSGGSVKVSTGMKMASLADLAKELQEQGEEVFRRNYPCPFLVVIFAPPADIGWGNEQTAKTTQSNLKDLGLDTSIKPIKLTIPLHNSERDRANPNITVGRSKNSDIILRSSRISKLHASFTPEKEGGCVLLDTSSANGTVVNGTPLEKNRYYKLNSGDMVSMWRYLFQFVELESILILLREKS